MPRLVTIEIPCRCGEVHRGPYAAETRNHHECFHDSPLVAHADGQVMCMDCGKVFALEVLSRA